MGAPEDGEYSLQTMLDIALEQKDPAIRLMDLNTVSTLARGIADSYGPQEKKIQSRRELMAGAGFLLGFMALAVMCLPLAPIAVLYGAIFMGPIEDSLNRFIRKGATKAEEAEAIAYRADSTLEREFKNLDAAALAASPLKDAALLAVPGLSEAFNNSKQRQAAAAAQPAPAAAKPLTL